MPAWSIAHKEKSRTLSRHMGDNSQPDDDPQWIKALRYKYKIWSEIKLPGRNYKCFFCRKHGKNTTGHLPGLGPIMKCPACQREYDETVQALSSTS